DEQQHKPSGQEDLGDDLMIVKAVGKSEIAASETDFTPSELFVAKPEKIELSESNSIELSQDNFEEEIVVDKKEANSSTDKVSDERTIDEDNEMPRLIQDAILAAKAEWSKEQLADKDLLPSDTAKPIGETEHMCNYPRSGSFSISLLILLAGFAMGGMCVYCYFLSKNIEDKTLLLNQSIQPLSQVSTLAVDTVATDTLSNLTDTTISMKHDSTRIMSVATLQNKNVESESFEKTTSDNKDLSIQIKLKNGMRLALLAEQYYGNKVFWVYIYEANKDVIKNPNILPVGVMIDIPAKSLYSINAKDSTSLEKAKKLQSQLLGKFE
ncbi:MAG: LysM peptidoglycan-binding domain-containing protein, partial [Tannerellaceae bacterium]